MKRFIFIAFAMMMCLVGKAYEWTDENGTTWNFTTQSGNKATLYYRGWDNASQKSLPCVSGTIPNELTIPSVVYIGSTAYTVTSIGSSAFNGCSNLTSIDIPDNVTSIGDVAFSGCSGLSSIDIPDNVTSIGSSAFQSCSSLTSIDIPDNVTSIGSSAFYGCSSLTSIDIPDNVTFIGSYAFSGCSSLTSIDIPDNVTSIEGGVFQSCSSLTSIDIPDNVTSINSYAFNGCSSLTSIDIPDNVTSINSYAFSCCYRLSSLYIKDLKKWLQITFNGACSNPLQDAQSNVDLYINNTLVTTITIPEGVTQIPSYAFKNCSKITSVTLPIGVTSIGQYAFYGCSNLTSINISDGVTSIGQYAFSSCSNLTSINIPESVESIGNYAFNGVRYMHCENETPCTIGGNVLPLTSTIFVPDAAVEDYRAAWTSYSDIIVGNSFDNLVEATVEALPSTSDLRAEIVGDKDEDEGEELLRSVVKLKVSGTINGYDMMIIRNKMTNLRELDLEEVTIVANDYEYYQGCHSEDNVFGGSFLRDTKIRSVVLPTTATRIGSYAFSGCRNLQTIDNYSNITSIGESAFYNCSNLSAIVIPRSITQIPNMCFYGCTKLDEIKLSPKTTNINGFAFEDCPGLTEFRLPPYLQSIGNSAFSRCNNLKEIYAYMVDVPAINTNTFNDYKHQILYVPQFLYNKYYYDTNWSQFLEVRVCDLQPGDYESFYTNSDVVFEDGERIDQDTPDVEIGEHGGVIVEGNDPQNFDDVEQNVGDTGGGSIIGENGNIIVNKLKLKLQVKANQWIGFNFPYDVTIADCEYPGQYVWIEYDGEARANGNSGWKVVTGEKLTANKGYMFMSSAKGKLIVAFDHPSFGGDKEKPLQSYTSGNAANAGWNFIGNPYSSYYALDENDFSAPITIWNGTSYEAYRPGDDDIHLQPYQAFFVQMPQHVYVVNFDKDNQETYTQSQQTQANQAKMRKVAGIKPERLLINLTISDNDTTTVDKTRLVLNEKASRGYELECDAAKFISDKAEAQLYLLENGVQMAIDERPTKGDICLGYMAKQAGKLRIEATRMDMPMVLVDTKTHQTFDLSLGNYEFETEAGTYDKRFMLRLSEEATAIKSLTAKTGVAVGLQDGGLSFGGAEGKSISIYNANGMLMTQQSGNGFVSLPSGLYLVKVDEISAKIYVK